MREKTLPAPTFGALILFLAAGCAKEPVLDLAPGNVPPEKVLVTVNGEPLSIDEFDSEFRLMQIHYSAVTEGEMRAIKRRLFEQIINRRLLTQRARRDSITLTQKEGEAALQQASQDIGDDLGAVLKAQGVTREVWKWKVLQERLAQKVVQVEVDSKVLLSDQEVEDYYWSHLPNYWSPEAVHARHLVVQRHGDLEKVLASLGKGEDLSKLASIFSVGMERAQGGDWGFMDLERLSPGYVKVLRGLKPGEISKPYKDNFGYHLFQLIEWRARRMRSFAEVRDRIREDLSREEKDQRFNEWMAGMKRSASIKVNKDMGPVIGVPSEE